MCLWRAVMSVLKMLALFFKKKKKKANVEVGKRGESGNLNCKKKKAKLATQLRVFDVRAFVLMCNLICLSYIVLS